MEAIAGYESDVESTQTVDADDIQVNQVDLTGSQEYGEALPGTQEYDETVELAESLFHIVRPEDAFEYIRPVQLPENHQMLAMDLLNAFNAAPRQPAQEREAPLAIEDTVPAEGTLPDEGRNFRPLAHRMIGRSRSRSTGRSVGCGPPIPTADELPPLPPKPAKKRGRRLLPRSTPPRANYGWDITRTVRAINRCQLPGRWYQGGQNDRITYTNDEQSYYIHQQSNSMWVQGREDAVVNARLVASIARDDDSARPWAARAR